MTASNSQAEVPSHASDVDIKSKNTDPEEAERPSSPRSAWDLARHPTGESTERRRPSSVDLDYMLTGTGGDSETVQRWQIKPASARTNCSRCNRVIEQDAPDSSPDKTSSAWCLLHLRADRSEAEQPDLFMSEDDVQLSGPGSEDSGVYSGRSSGSSQQSDDEEGHALHGDEGNGGHNGEDTDGESSDSSGSHSDYEGSGDSEFGNESPQAASSDRSQQQTLVLRTRSFPQSEHLERF